MGGKFFCHLRKFSKRCGKFMSLAWIGKCYLWNKSLDVCSLRGQCLISKVLRKGCEKNISYLRFLFDICFSRGQSWCQDVWEKGVKKNRMFAFIISVKADNTKYEIWMGKIFIISKKSQKGVKIWMLALLGVKVWCLLFSWVKVW